MVKKQRETGLIFSQCAKIGPVKASRFHGFISI